MGALQMRNPQMPDLFEMAGDKNLISLGLEGKAKMAVGVNLGVMWDINEQWSLGFTYRSKLKMKVDSGSIDLRMIDNTQIAQVIGQLLPQLGLDPAKLTSAVVKTEPVSYTHLRCISRPSTSKEASTGFRAKATISRLRRKPYTNSRSSSTPTAREIYFKPARTMISHILIKGKAFSGFPFYSSISASYSAFSPNGYWFWCTSSKRIPFS